MAEFRRLRLESRKRNSVGGARRTSKNSLGSLQPHARLHLKAGAQDVTDSFLNLLSDRQILRTCCTLFLKTNPLCTPCFVYMGRDDGTRARRAKGSRRERPSECGFSQFSLKQTQQERRRNDSSDIPRFLQASRSQVARKSKVEERAR